MLYLCIIAYAIVIKCSIKYLLNQMWLTVHFIEDGLWKVRMSCSKPWSTDGREASRTSDSGLPSQFLHSPACSVVRLNVRGKPGATHIKIHNYSLLRLIITDCLVSGGGDGRTEVVYRQLLSECKTTVILVNSNTLFDISTPQFNL